MDEEIVRRPLSTRNTKWAAVIARRLANFGLRPNQISVLSLAFAACSGGCFVGSSIVQTAASKIWLLIGAALFIQLRLLCNLFDGMVAIEGGFRTKSGEVFNDFPDRIADAIILVPVGYAIGAFPFGHELGWLAGLLAVMTAYVRVLGGSCGTKQDFRGPMAKQHRMAVITIASVLAAVEVFFHWPARILPLALILIVVGCVVTVIRRVYKIIVELESK
jgi:phosphatidylglycerophosphate synthase